VIKKYELLPSPGELAQLPVKKAELDRLVDERVAEILHAREEFIFEPFFRSRQIAYELKRLQTVSEQRKWTVYFQRFGCLVCETSDRIHAGNAMCSRCHANTQGRLKQILGELIRDQTARPARGRLRLDRLLPPSHPMDGVHHSRYQPSTKLERELFDRVAKELGLTYEYVRSIGVGMRSNKAVAAALKKAARDRLRQNLKRDA
jgi:hypothetical protein